MEVVRNYLITFVVYFAIEMVWLLLIAKNLYAKYIGHLMADKPNLVVSLVYFIIVIAGLIFFAINPAIEKNSLSYAILAGVIFGFMTYATYTMTNLATLKDWPMIIAFVDIAWGTLLNGLTAGISFYIINFFITK